MRYILLLAAAVSLSACTGSFYKVPSPDYDRAKYEEVGTDSVTATGIHLFQLFPINLTNKIERAVEQLIAQNGGDTVTDIEVQERWFWAYVLNGYKTEVRGTVLKKK